MKIADKIRGCLIGGAIGDAAGGPYEGRVPPFELSDSRPWKLSDDTQLTLATCEAIIREKGEILPSTIAASFAAWHKEGRVTGVGASTYKALTELAHGGHWALVGRKGEMAAGNGAAMRIAPLAFLLNPEATNARRLIRDVSRITHHNDEAYAGALAVLIAVRAAYDGAWSGQTGLLQLIVQRLPDSLVGDRLAELANLQNELPLREAAERFGCSGYVAESVPLALLGAQRIAAVGFEQGLREIISVGGDTDTNAAIAGQIIGTRLGYNALPQELIARLPEKRLIEKTADELARTVTERASQ